MELAVLLPIAAFIALAAGLVVVLQRTGRIVARTRELEVFKTNVIDLASRVDSSLGGAAGQIDAVRRRQLAPDAIGETLEAATDAVEQYANEARALRGPPGDEPAPQRHHRGAGAGRPGARDGRARDDDASQQPAARELEAQTSIKRGYLNLLHAREAIARHALGCGRSSPDADDTNGARTDAGRPHHLVVSSSRHH